VAFEYLSDQNIFDEVANAGSRKHLQQACDTWRNYDTDSRRERLKHFRDKVVAHTGERDPKIPAPLISELRDYAMGTADASAKAFWSVWRDRS
jgi:hypothetical protein